MEISFPDGEVQESLPKSVVCLCVVLTNLTLALGFQGCVPLAHSGLHPPFCVSLWLCVLLTRSTAVEARPAGHKWW